MSIIGAQGVSMSELTGMGLDRLNAMAQGQQPSIAPSYLVLAAIEQLKKGKAGEQAPLPQGTVKDRLLASINQPPPMQAGIGQMAPQQPQTAQPMPPTQRMSGGGLVQHFDDGGTPESDRYKIMQLLRGAGNVAEDAVDAGADVASMIPRGIAGAVNSGLIRPARAFGATVPYIPDIEGADYDSMTPYADFRAKQRAKNDPTTRIGTEKGRATNKSEATQGTETRDYGNEARRSALTPTSPNNDPTGVGASISASSRSRGIGSTGTSPLATYATLDPQKTAADFKLNIPNNEQLAAAAKKFSAPDAARMAELQGAESRAGLGAFARGMMNTDRGRGFGAVFGSAAADANDAREKRADARREYEDKREMMATQLGIQMGDEVKQKYLTESKWGADRAQEANKLAVDVLQAKNQGTHFGNQDIIDREKAQLMAEANRIAAEARRDGLTAAHHDRIQKLYLTAQEIAIKAAESKFGKTDPMLAQTPQGAQREAAKQTMYEAEYAKAVSALEARLGGEGNSKAAGNAVIRKAY
jgi:hypothetical protein